MGLTMSEKKALTRETAARYRAAERLAKQAILDEFTQVTGYHRKYAISLLRNWGTERVELIDGEAVRLVVGQPRKNKSRRRPARRIYDEPVIQALRRIWELFDYMCGKRLAVLMRLNMELLQAEPELGIDEPIAAKLVQISPATIDRLLSGARKALLVKGRSRTRGGTLLKHQIPIRAFFDWDERRPGFFELDTVAHDGGNARGEYCQTLNATDVSSGWVELRALPNRAHRWVKQEVESIRNALPFALQGVDSDNGGEFINHQLWQWCNLEGISFTRGRPYRKNDNCFVEQKNDLAVRRTVGYYRFEGQQQHLALAEVYRHLCPLLNFYYPSVKIIEKTRVGAHVKKRYDAPKPPYQRLLESEHLDEQTKRELTRRAASIHIVKQKRLVDKAVANLMRIYEAHRQHDLPLDRNSDQGAQSKISE